MRSLNRSQGLVIGFYVTALIALVAILVFAPAVYAHALKAPQGNSQLLETGFLVALTAFICLLAIGVILRWRWMYWLNLIAFLAGALRVPVSVLQLSGTLPSSDPAWYAVFQALVGLVQFVIGVMLLRGYRKAGVWGAF